jgi:Cu(I)/Ag(I) efflux system membrane protein CusA/SilA
MLPIGVLMSIIVMHTIGLNSNIMSCGAIAIAIGAMVDAAIVMIENAHKHIERAPPDARACRSSSMPAAKSGPALFFSLLDHHRLVPVGIFARSAGRQDVHAACLHQDIRHGRSGAVVDHAGAGADAAVHPRQNHAGEEKSDQSLPHLDLPPDHRLGDALEEAHHHCRPGRAAPRLSRHAPGQRIHAGAQRRFLLFMPATLPSLSMPSQRNLLQTQDRILKGLSRGNRCSEGWARAATATDPAPVEMFETVDQLKARTNGAPV